MADLDLLDLDDMFNDDGDQLFEGLDIELDGMGDIISNEKKEKPPQTAAATPPPAARRAGGPRTKKTNPMLEKAAEEDDDGTTPKRRKTKRKSKAPSAYDDDEFIVDEQPKKKRKAALKAKKATEPMTKTKRKKKAEEVTTPSPAAPPAPPPPTVLAASTSMASKAKSSGPTVSVAAAGQFGGRVKRGSASSMGGTKVKRRLKKSTAGGVETETPGGGIAVAPKPDSIKPPKPEPTFGGLAPSRQFFYPFLESVPPEPSMQKRKAYPVLDRINSALTSQIASSTNATQHPTQAPRPGVPTEETAIFKLMLETYESNEKDKLAFTAEKHAALLKGIPVMRDMIHGLDKPRLVGDVFSMCWLLTRQYNFINQSLENMKNWCKDEFTDEDYRATYDPPVEKPKHSKWKSPVVKVKISFNGYKEPKGTPPLIGVLPPMVVDAAAVSRASIASTAAAVAEAKLKVFESKKSTIPTVKTTAATAKTKKKKEMATGKTTKAKTVVVATTLPASVPTSVVARTYTSSSPQARRQQIMEKVAKLALQLENAQQTEQIVGKLDPIPEEDPPLHTTRMWEFLQKAGFYKDPPSKRLGLRSPEVNPRAVFLPVPTKIRGREAKEDKFSQHSLFDRLQSLLVEENIDGNENDDDEDSDSDDDSLDFLEDDDDDDGFGFKTAEEDTDENDDRNVGLADLSGLSIEERTFIQLASAGLIRKSLFPMVELIMSSDEEDDENDGLEDDMVNVIGKMSSDLSAITAKNNARVSYLETATAGPNLLHKKQIEEEQAALIAKCQNLIKRNKEKAKKAKQKKDDNLNLPW
jgi:hypothetical protein